MGRRICLVILFLGILSTVRAEDLDSLLKKYSELSKLYKKTVEESEGHLILFTREDIEKFQYYTLSDILQVIRYFTLQRNQFGEKVLSYATIYPVENSTVRLFINDHEVSSVFRKTALPMWADLPLEFVEHIEVYQGESAVKFNSEAAGMIIKVYTKRPEKENGGKLRGSLSSRGGFFAGGYIGMEVPAGGRFSVFVSKARYLSRKYHINSRTGRIDEKYTYAYTQFGINGWNFESGMVDKKADRFRGLTLHNFPESSDFTGSHGFVSLSKLVSPELKLKVRFYADKITKNSYQQGSQTDPVLAFRPLQPVLWWNVEIDSYKIGMDISGEKRIKKALFFFGTKLQRSSYTLRDYRNTGSFIDRNYENFTSGFIESVYNVFPRLGLIAGLKFEKLNRKYGTDVNSILWRTGIISVYGRDRYLKLFVSRYHTPPYFVELYTTPNLKKQKNDVLSAELSEKNRFGRFIITGGYIRTSDAIMIDQNDFSYFNSSQTLKYAFYSFDYIKKLEKIKLHLNFFSVNVNNTTFETAPEKGGSLRLLYAHEKFTSFAECIYRDSYRFAGRKIKESYQLNVGLSFKPFKNSIFQLKGYNLLNAGIKTPAYIDPDFKYYLEDKKVIISFIREF
ncbi:TonB-dependent receptor plug domain-containing protein [Persephonella sp.]